jgi:hypothetical protein
MPSVMELERLMTIFMGDATGLLRECDRVERALVRTARQAENCTNIISRTFTTTVGIAQAAATTLIAVADATKYIALEAVKTSAKMEALEASFRALVGSATEANALIQDLTNFALSSPFLTPQLLEAGIELAAFGRSAEEILPDLKMIGDISRGDAQRFKEMVYIYGKIIESGRLYQRDINQLAIRGVPVYIELAKMLGLVEENAKKVPKEVYTRIRGLVQTGQIDSEMIGEVFKKITAPGGLFFGQMEARMKTLTGMFSNLKEQIFTTMRNIGDTLVEGINLKPITLAVQQMAKEFSTFLKNLSPETKDAIRVVLTLTTVFLGLAIAVRLLGIVFAVMFGWGTRRRDRPDIAVDDNDWWARRSVVSSQAGCDRLLGIHPAGSTTTPRRTRGDLPLHGSSHRGDDTPSS